MFRLRRERLEYLQSHIELLPAVKSHYRDNVAQFISDWGCTFDPRNVARGIPSHIPFILFPKQVEFVEWVLKLWHNREPGIVPKSREVGASWLTGAIAVVLCRFYSGVTIGFGSRKEDLVDNSQDPDSQFWKIRYLVSNLPAIFLGGWLDKTDSRHMFVGFRDTNSSIKGEAGDNIGRGGRSSITFIDEAAHLPRPKQVDLALSMTTDTRIDFSSVNGKNNPFAEKMVTWPEHRIFLFHWRDDPRKDDAWYRDQVEKLGNPIIVAQELDIDTSASMDGGIIPGAWIEAAVDAHIKLGIQVSGERHGAMDVADQGHDKNAFAGGHGILVEFLDEWSGKGGDIFESVEKCFHHCDVNGYPGFRYDGDGLGAGVRGDARIINERRRDALAKVNPMGGERLRQAQKDCEIAVSMFRGSEAVLNPDKEDVNGRKNIDFFENRKAQAWWSLRLRFMKTYRAVIEGLPYEPDEIISLSSKLPKLVALITELAQPTFGQSKSGKLLIQKAPEGNRSPNLADAVMILMAEDGKKSLRINSLVLNQLAAAAHR